MNVTRFIMLLLVALACQSGVGCSGRADKAKQDAPGSADTAQTPASRDSIVIELAGKDSVSVFDLLRESYAVCYQSTVGGVFVKQIDSAKSGTSVFWIYSVNDSMPNVAADRFITHTGDRVKWYFRKMGK
ncbi:MAG: DUF4430 domain-containing protein [candidate division Zixibacteria bacterium]|nr:DUF4430 domain-containing protein [candidate division Zixibacteria bacterium]